MDHERYEQGKALYARWWNIAPEEVPAFFAGRVGARFGRGAILATPGAWADDALSLRDLSLVVVTALITLGGAEEQLRNHPRLAALDGCTRNELESVGPLLAIYIGQPRAGNGLTLVRETLAELEAANGPLQPATGGRGAPEPDGALAGGD